MNRAAAGTAARPPAAAPPKPSLAALRRDLRAAADPVRARNLARFFKTGPGQYGHGDAFLGLTVPKSRAIAARYVGLTLADVARALRSRFHEERLVAWLLVVNRYARGDARARRAAYAFYLRHADRADNWDLVDLSAHKVVGRHLLDASFAQAARVLDGLARQPLLWRRRVAVVATFAFIARGELRHSFRLADLLLARGEREDLMHKAAGWMLREAGKKDRAALTAWLAPRHARMPRTMLRYAIERFPERERRAYLLPRGRREAKT
jgi:3-methyladenine DNA glycosylase AlkD